MLLLFNSPFLPAFQLPLFYIFSPCPICIMSFLYILFILFSSCFSFWYSLVQSINSLFCCGLIYCTHLGCGFFPPPCPVRSRGQSYLTQLSQERNQAQNRSASEQLVVCGFFFFNHHLRICLLGRDDGREKHGSERETSVGSLLYVLQPGIESTT